VRLLLALLLAATAAPAATEVADSELLVEGRVRDVRTLDLDGDSLQEVLVFSVAGHAQSARRMVSVFWQDPTGRLPRAPHRTWELGRRVAALDATSGDGALGLYSLQDDGVFLHTFRKDRPVHSLQVLRHAFPGLLPSDESIPLLDFAGPWKAPGNKDLLVPSLPFPLLFQGRRGPDGDGITLPVTVAAQYSVSRTQPLLSSSYRHPAAATWRRPSGGHQLLFVERDAVAVLDPHHVLDGMAQMRSFPVEILDEKEALADKDTVETRLVDLNGDRRLDLVAVVYRESGVLELSGRVMVFFARKDGSFRRHADQTLQVEDGIYYMTRIQDRDGDGRMEIMLPSYRLGIWGYLRVLTSGKINFTVNTLTLTADGVYDVEAATRDPFTIRLSDHFDIPAIVYGDFDGDAVEDIAVGRGETRMCIHRGLSGSEKRGFTAKPSHCFEADPYQRYVTGRLRGHRDFLMRFRTAGEGRNVVTVTFLQPPAPLPGPQAAP
jgi:hypothetical protein